MSSNKSGRVVVAAALAAALFLAVPAAAFDGREAPQGPLERLVAWFAETWVSAGLPGVPNEGGTGTNTVPQNPPTPPGEGDPEGCRNDYTACIDPNG